MGPPIRKNNAIYKRTKQNYQSQSWNIESIKRLKKKNTQDKVTLNVEVLAFQYIYIATHKQQYFIFFLCWKYSDALLYHNCRQIFATF